MRAAIRLATALLVIAMASSALAVDCERPGTNKEMTECAALRLKAANREMAEICDVLLRGDDKDLAAAVAKAQDAWLRWRDAEGALAVKFENDPELAEYARLRQEAQMTEDRIKDLRGMAGD